jgi:2-polyprenyl-3-methyl-5-hydroxy-6-metoxy-1,4-benzoquinol methylase
MEMGSSASIGLPGQSVSAAVADLKSAVCPLCDARNSLSLFTQSSYTLMHCEECDLSFIHPYPKNVKQHHEAVSEYDYAEMEVVRCATQYKNEKLFYERYFELVDAECREASSFLDVGCVWTLAGTIDSTRHKLQRVGIELNRERAEFARKTAGCEIVEGPIEDFGAERRYDVIALINVISHIPDIGQLFGRLRCLLAEGGRVIIKTGEMKREVKKSAILDWEFPDHLHFLGWRTLEYVCARHGFRVRKHLRTTLAKERFTATTWRMKGRSGIRNAIKAGVTHMPFALEFLASCYDAVHHGSISSSFIVLQAE